MEWFEYVPMFFTSIIDKLKTIQSVGPLAVKFSMTHQGQTIGSSPHRWGMQHPLFALGNDYDGHKP